MTLNKAHTHNWIPKKVTLRDDGSNAAYNRSKEGWEITGYVCRSCGQKDYVDLLKKSIDT